MLQVSPTGPAPGRVAPKVAQPEAADAAFPEWALLAAQPESNVHPTGGRGPAEVSHPEEPPTPPGPPNGEREDAEAADGAEPAATAALAAVPPPPPAPPAADLASPALQVMPPAVGLTALPQASLDAPAAAPNLPPPDAAALPTVAATALPEGVPLPSAGSAPAADTSPVPAQAAPPAVTPAPRFLPIPPAPEPASAPKATPPADPTASLPANALPAALQEEPQTPQDPTTDGAPVAASGHAPARPQGSNAAAAAAAARWTGLGPRTAAAAVPEPSQDFGTTPRAARSTADKAGVAPIQGGAPAPALAGMAAAAAPRPEPRLPGPGPVAGPKPAEPAPKEEPRPAAAGKSEPPPARTPEAAPAEGTAAAARPAAENRDPAPPLARSESLGLQPTAQEPRSLTADPASARPPAPTWQAPVPSLLHQVENGIRWMLRNASPGAELQLHPEALGRVRIELKVEGGEVHARMWASDPKSIPVLQENRAFLEVSLREQGLNLGSFDLRQQSHQSQPQLSEGQSRGQFWPTEAVPEPRQEPPTDPVHSRGNPRRIELIA